jgi:LacI family transcriptional regulator
LSSRKPTVLDVARVASVAPSTVSRCLRGGPYVSDEVRKRITDAVQSLGYEPNEIARSLRGGRTKSIGVVFPQIANPYFSRCVQEIELEATRQGWSVILLTHQEDPERQSKQLAVLRRSRADGVILTASPDSNMEKLRQELGSTPVVALDRPLWAGADVVMLKHGEAARTATTHLLKHGLREIVCVTANPSIYSFKERIAGYESAMLHAKLHANVITANDYEMLEMLVGRSVLKGKKPIGLIALSNMATVSALKAIREVQAKGLRKIGLIGFDDADLAVLVQPAITVMVQPTDVMARESVRLLFKRIGADKSLPIQRVELPGTLIKRSSCGCP